MRDSDSDSDSDGHLVDNYEIVLPQLAPPYR